MVKATNGTFRVTGSTGNVYTVTFPNGDAHGAYCSCPAWKYQRIHPARRTCKHITAILRGLRVS